MAVRDVVQAAAGAGGDKLYVEDVFSTYLYTGNGSTQTINNGIDLDGEGGLVWIKSRGVTGDHSLFDTARIDNDGVSKVLNTNSTSNARNFDAEFPGVTSSGFNIASGVYNISSALYASWTFRKAPKFFDVVTWTGNGSNRTVTHDLGSVPGMIMVKRTDDTGDWQVYHRANTANPETDYLVLNSTAATADSNTRWNDTLPTDAVFSLGTEATVNASGGTYVAYLFAHDAGGFGNDGQQNVVSCGSFTTSSGGNTISLGWEPQFVLAKSVSSVTNWYLLDTMRGMVAGTKDFVLKPNLTSAEATDNINYITPQATGFQSDFDDALGAGVSMIYIAIRRGPMKTPESGTEVFEPDLSPNSNNPRFISGFPVDMAMERSRTSTGVEGMDITSRLTANRYLRTGSTNAEATSSSLRMDYMNGFDNDGDTSPNWVAHMFRRAPGFFDVVAYTGDGTAGHVINHNLNVAPEWIITKKRSSGGSFNDWYTVSSVYYNTTPYDRQSALNFTNGFTGGGFISAADSTSFTLANPYIANESGHNIVAYLFASVAGVSKVGTYTGTGSDIEVNCGFSSGARFVYIQRADATGDGKYVWDTARGIVSGNDPYLLLNSTAAEVTSTDYIDPIASGFKVTASAPTGLNTSGGTYFFLAIS